MPGAHTSFCLLTIALTVSSIISALPLEAAPNDNEMVKDLRAEFAEFKAKLNAENEDLRQRVKAQGAKIAWLQAQIPKAPDSSGAVKMRFGSAHARGCHSLHPLPAPPL